MIVGGAGAALALATATVPASAASPEVYCVDVSHPSCTTQLPAGDATGAFTAANGNAGADTILLGHGTYTAATIDSFRDTGNGDAVHVIGAGKASTILTGPDVAGSQTYLHLSSAGSTVSDLTVELQPGANSDNDTGLVLNDSAATRVDVEGAGTDNALGLILSSSAMGSASFDDGDIRLPRNPPVGDRGVFIGGNATLSRAKVVASLGIDVSDAGAGHAAEIESVKLLVHYRGVGIDVGTANVTNAVIDLGSGGMGAAGLAAQNSNPGTAPKTINARHVTIVGGGPGSAGVLSEAAAPSAQQVSTATLRDSVIAGPPISIRRIATNTTGMPSTANVTTSYSNYDPATASDTNGVNGAGSISASHQTNLAPGFVDAPGGNLHLALGSALIDIGDPAGGGPTTDLDGSSRVVDGDGDGSKRRDPGALEFQYQAPPDTSAPQTKVGQVPRRLRRKSVRVRFTSSEHGSTFECRLDKAHWRACSSPLRLRGLKLGRHRIAVRATDAVGNTDRSPARRSFKRLAPRRR